MITEAEVRDAVFAALPAHSFVRQYVEYAQRQTSSPLGYHLACALSLLGATVPVPYGTFYAGTLRSNLFTLLIGRSGEDQKSSALGIARELLFEAIPPLIGDFPGSAEGLIDSLQRQNTQMIPISEFGKFLSSAQQGYFEPVKALLADLWDCLDADTRVLTPDGWKGLGEVRVGDLIWTLNTETDRLELTPALDVGVRSVRPNEKMVSIQTNRHDIRVTEGHRIYYKYRAKGKPSKWKVRTAGEMAARKNSFLLASGAPVDPCSDAPLTDDELRFVAWFLTDGGFSKTDVLITQSFAKPNQVARIRILLDRLGFDYRELERPAVRSGAYPTEFAQARFYVPKGSIGGTLARAGWARLAPWLNKDLPARLFSLSPRQVAILFEEALQGDGDERGVLWCAGKATAEMLQQIALRAGFAATVRKVQPKGKNAAYTLRVYPDLLTSVGSVSVSEPQVEDAHPEERVWCVTNKNSTLVTERNGKVTILGNCLPTQRAKANGKVVRCDHPRLSVLAACSLPYLEQYTTGSDWSGGFMGRWAVIYARRERTDPDPKGDRTGFEELKQILYDRGTRPSLGFCMGLDKEAGQLWADWFNDVSSRDLPAQVIGVRARAPTIARKVAMLYGSDFGPAHLDKDWVITKKELIPAILFTELHIKSLVGLSEHICSHHDARQRREVLAVLAEEGGYASLGTILNRLKLKKRTVIETLDALICEGLVARATLMGGSDAGGFYTLVDPLAPPQDAGPSDDAGS